MKQGILSSISVLMLGVAALAAEKPDATKQADPPAAAPIHVHRPSNVVFILIETSEFDTTAVDELQRMYDVLRKLDTDKDGKISASALQTARVQIVADRADDIIRKLDADKDGKISRAEAKGRVLEHFDHIDADKDGFIDRDEMIRAITAHVKNAAK
jgi:Ca2+-binding EF-hand superfamily protein